MKPGVPSPVAYWCMRGWQRPGMKPPGQRNSPLWQRLTPRGGPSSASANADGVQGLSGKVNTSELLINIVNAEQAKGADRLEPKGMWPVVSQPNRDTRMQWPPVKRQDLTRSLLLVRNMVSPYSRPRYAGASEPQGTPLGVRVKEGRESECQLVIGWIGVVTSPRCESTPTSTWSFMTRAFDESL